MSQVREGTGAWIIKQQDNPLLLSVVKATVVGKVLGSRAQVSVDNECDVMFVGGCRVST